ncbi:hypothetical protein JCM10213_007037 [Rhodosporidiobolus nylandii]
MSTNNSSNNLFHTVLACVTGASGFVGAAVALEFLRRGHSVRLPLRKQEQADDWLAKYGKEYEGKIQTIVLEKEMSEDGAFDKAVEGCEVVVHTASPATFDIEVSPEEDILKPALRGTLSLLESAKRASSVKSVVITSSIAAHISLEELVRAQKKLTATSWNNFAYEEAAKMPHDQGGAVYFASKGAAEKAAWDFMRQPGVHFSLATCAPATVLGHNSAPDLKSLKDARSTFGMTLEALWDKKELPPAGPLALWVSVDDVARAHVSAALNPSVANGQRYLLISATTNFEEITRIMLTHQPELKAHLPPVPEKETMEKSKIQYEAGEAEKDLGFEYESLNTFVGAFAKQVYDLAKADGVL